MILFLEKGELEDIVQGKTLSGEIANYNEIGEILLSINKEEFPTGYYFKLDWNKEEPLKYHFKLSPSGMENLRERNYVYGRYEDGVDGSKLGIYGDGRNDLTKDNIQFAIQMIKLNKQEQLKQPS